MSLSPAKVVAGFDSAAVMLRATARALVILPSVFPHRYRPLQQLR